MKMKAAIGYHDGKPARIEEVEIGEPQAGEVLVRIHASGVCHSDLTFGLKGTKASGQPIIIGHEASGVVEKTGVGVRRLSPGDRVILSWLHPDGPVPNDRYTLGASNPDRLLGLGTIAEYAMVYEKSAIKIEEDIDHGAASLIGCCVMTGVGAAVKTAQIKPGASVLVFGAGGVGLNVIQGAALDGATTIIAVDLLDNKLDWAKAFGATATINGSQEDVAVRVKELTKGKGVDYAFDVVGDVDLISMGLELLKQGGLLIMVGVSFGDRKLELDPWVFARASIVGCRYGDADPPVDFPWLVALYKAKKIKLDELVTRRYALDDVNKAFEDMEKGINARGVIQLV